MLGERGLQGGTKKEMIPPQSGSLQEQQLGLGEGGVGGVLGSAVDCPSRTPSLGLRPRPKLHRLWAGMWAHGGVMQA